MSSIPQQIQPQVIRVGSEIRSLVVESQRNGLSVGVVPTMGALHEGHLSLVKAARAECDVVVVTIFVNPTQFEPHEDFQEYPRQLEKDLEKLLPLDCDVVFAPSVEEMYPTGFDTKVDVGAVARSLEGAIRPNHFQGVATVVLKLLMQAPADRAYFGQKDYQQTLVVNQLVSDLDIPVEICICPIVREADGLAMSSRNAYLSTIERDQASVLHKCLQLANRLVMQGTSNVASIRRELENLASDSGVKLEYAAFLKKGSIVEVDEISGPIVLALAAKIGQTRLIDNIVIG